MGNGTGAFAYSATYKLGVYYYSLAIGDFTGDGWADIAAADNGDGSRVSALRMLINTGTGSFEPDTTFDLGPHPTAILAGNLNGDPYTDLVVTSGASTDPQFGALEVLLGCGACVSTAINVDLTKTWADESGIHLQWIVQEPSGSWAVLDRRTSSEEWRTVTELAITSSLLRVDDPDVVAGQRYAYRLTIHSPDGIITTPEFWVDAAGTALPRSVVLQSPRPNPSGGQIHIRLGLPQAGPSDLAVFDVAGRLVARISAGPRSAGWHDLSWDGRDQRGRPVGSGTYFLRLTSGSTVSRRFVVLR